MARKLVFYSVCSCILTVCAQTKNCELRGNELVCQDIYNCSDLRHYRGSPAKYLTLINSCQSAPLQADDLYKFQNVSRLDLTYTEIAPDVLKNLRRLVVLAINHSSLRILHWDMFVSNEKLTRLDLRNNNIHYLPAKAFSPLMHLRTFLLAGNAIISWEPGVFRDNKLLRTVDLSDNNISRVRSDLFPEGSQIYVLNFSRNVISEIEGSVFKNLSQLADLDLSYNVITSVESFLFEVLKYRSDRIATSNEEVVPVNIMLNGNSFRCVCGAFAEAYAQNIALGLKLNVICGDGQPWNVLQSPLCSLGVSTERESLIVIVPVTSSVAANDSVATSSHTTTTSVSVLVNNSATTGNLPASIVTARPTGKNCNQTQTENMYLHSTSPANVINSGGGEKTQDSMYCHALVSVCVIFVLCLLVLLGLFWYCYNHTRGGGRRGDNEASVRFVNAGSTCSADISFV